MKVWVKWKLSRLIPRILSTFRHPLQSSIIWIGPGDGAVQKKPPSFSDLAFPLPIQRILPPPQAFSPLKPYNLNWIWGWWGCRPTRISDIQLIPLINRWNRQLLLKMMHSVPFLSSEVVNFFWEEKLSHLISLGGIDNCYWRNIFPLNINSAIDIDIEDGAWYACSDQTFEIQKTPIGHEISRSIFRLHDFSSFSWK